MNGILIFEYAKKISKNIIYLLPKNVTEEQIGDLLEENEKCEFEWNYYNDKLKSITCYFGFGL